MTAMATSLFAKNPKVACKACPEGTVALFPAITCTVRRAPPAAARAAPPRALLGCRPAHPHPQLTDPPSLARGRRAPLRTPPQICPPGTFADRAAGRCTKCPAGSFNRDVGASACTPCEAGSFDPVRG